MPVCLRALFAVGLAAIAAGCPKPTASSGADPDAVYVPRPRDDGPIAGPHGVVEGTEPMPASDTPGWGPLPPYMAAVRKVVTDRIDACSDRGEPVDSALLAAIVGPEGELREVSVVRSSGVETFDRCALRAFREARLPSPPPETLGEDGGVRVELAFRPTP